MPLAVRSDFFDYYDPWLSDAADADMLLTRFSRQGLARPDMLAYLSECGITTVRHGRVRDIAGSEQSVVVYTDQHAHGGDGKMLCTGKAALALYPDAYCSGYRPSARRTPQGDPCKSYSTRYLQVGKHAWWIDYWSTEDWRSNWGEGGTRVQWSPCYYPNFPYPLFAIDYVRPRMDITANALACDLNTAPGILGTGLEDEVSGKQFAEYLVAACVAQRDKALTSPRGDGTLDWTGGWK